MFYDVLAALWEGEGTDLDIALAIEARTGSRFSREAANRYLRHLEQCGYARASGDRLAPRYRMTPEGSTLLARLARSMEFQQEYSHT